jgi:hypothetical protein
MAAIKENEWKKTAEASNVEIEWAKAVAEYRYFFNRAM